MTIMLLRIEFHCIYYIIAQALLVSDLITILPATFLLFTKITFKYKDVRLIYLTKLLVLYEIMLFIN